MMSDIPTLGLCMCEDKLLYKEQVLMSPFIVILMEQELELTLH